jgi:capsular exopolysaccharide synthesis family protein
MSRFFNETRKTFKQETAVPGPASVNLDEAVDAMRLSADTEHQPQLAIPSAPEALFGALHESGEIASQVAATRLEKCRSMKLPRGDERSFLAAQYNPSMQAAVEAYRTLRTRLVKRQTERGTRSLVIASAEPGDGKTLTALNLSLCYANIQNWPVLLVDADLRTRGLSRVLGDPESPGLGQILESGCPYQSAILSTNVPNLYVLPAGVSSTPSPELFSATSWAEFLGWGAESFRLVIIDSPPILDLADFELIVAPCESTLLIARTRKTSRESLTRAAATLDPKKLVGVVLNSVDECQSANYYYHRY